jgi:hypothetical protein
MCNSTRLTVPAYENPEFIPALEALERWCLGMDYNRLATSNILGVVAVTGCVHDAVTARFLEAEDEATAEEIFIEAMPPVPLDSESWDRQDMCLDAAMLAEGNHPWPIPLDCDAGCEPLPPIPDLRDPSEWPAYPSEADERWLRDRSVMYGYE